MDKYDAATTVTYTHAQNVIICISKRLNDSEKVYFGISHACKQYQRLSEFAR